MNSSIGGAPRAHVDALRLLAVFLAHWDNKAENQRLVCLSPTWTKGKPCPQPFLMLQDLGSDVWSAEGRSRGVGARGDLEGPADVHRFDGRPATRWRDVR